MLGLVRTF